MIATELHDGQGLGNQLWAYTVTRLIAEKNGYEFGIKHPERFKGRNFITLDFGKPVTEIVNQYREIENVVNGHSMWPYDPEMEKIPDGTILEGNFQSYSYLRGYEGRVRSWFDIKAPSTTLYDTCLIHFRAGDYVGIRDVFLPKSYYLRGMDKIREINPKVRFYLVSDQPELASEFLGVDFIGNVGEDPYKADHHRGGDIGIDFSYLLNAKYLIIPNSSFSWWAAFLNTKKEIVIAPEYWAGWKRKEWQTSDIKTDGFTYITP